MSGPRHLREQARGMADWIGVDMDNDMGVVRIPLTQGMFALVDIEDAHLVQGYSWYAHEKDSDLMHSLITGWSYTDHVNGNGLDNRSRNLRSATPAENGQNKRKKRGTKTRFKGVDQHGLTWRAEIRVNGKRYRRYSLPDEESAARAYDDLARYHHGQFARLNFPRPGERSAL
jgi:hypothetical protein